MRVALALSLGASLALCSPATAATTVRGAESGDVVTITDETGEINDLTVASVPDGSTVTVRDNTAPLQALGGCDEAADGAVRCPMRLLGTIEIHLAAGNDRMIASGPPLIRAFGEEGVDTLRGGTEFDTLEGGSGNDTIDGDLGPDIAVGGAGDDTLRGGRGDDTLLGGGSVLTPAGSGPPAGRDELDAGPGDDRLDDNDSDAPEIGADLVIGGTGFDLVGSYERRQEDVHVDLSCDGGDGEVGEDDSLENVEGVSGGHGDDVLIGDGDDNQLLGGGGSNRLRGRGGDDFLWAAKGRNSLRGDVGNDRLFTSSRNVGAMRCGGGTDRVHARRKRLNKVRPGDPRARGPLVSASCEAIAQGDSRWAVDPVPEPPSGHVLLFRRPAGARHGRAKTLAVTEPDPRYAELGRGVSRRRGVRVRVPADVARRAREGVLLRAEEYAPLPRAEKPTLQMIWRFRVPAR